MSDFDIPLPIEELEKFDPIADDDEPDFEADEDHDPDAEDLI